MGNFWQTTRFKINLVQPQVMGIVNITPDSFSDGGQHSSLHAALGHCELLLRQGAHILDIGGESTRPGSPPVPLQDELQRVLPLVKEVVKLGVPVSVDTYKPAVMQAVLDAGADIINDIWGLRMGGAKEVIARHQACGVCIMHMHGEPQSMQLMPMEGEITAAVKHFLSDACTEVCSLGVDRSRIVIDYGIGFGKTVTQNFELLANQEQILGLDFPLLAGWSRKSSLGAVTGREIDARMLASIASALIAVERGARIVRVHDVQETVDALKVWQASKV